MKLIIQIPCYNEEDTLAKTLADLPKQINGIDQIEVLIINDGSKDNTLEVALKAGVDHIINFTSNRGLARAFEAGMDKALKKGADIIVNTDADNQYNARDIEKLVQPIIAGQADMVVGDRQTNTIPHFNWRKKKLQRLGTKVVSALASTKVNDAVSGFRAFSQETALKINVLTDFSYTIETLIQLGQAKTKIISVPVGTNAVARESRLFKGIFSFIFYQLSTIMRVYATYKALRVFSITGIIIILPGLAGFGRFLYFYIIGQSDGHIQSLVFSTAFIVVGFLILMFGLMAELIANNRKLIEKILINQKQEQWKMK